MEKLKKIILCPLCNVNLAIVTKHIVYNIIDYYFSRRDKHALHLRDSECACLWGKENRIVAGETEYFVAVILRMLILLL